MVEKTALLRIIPREQLEATEKDIKAVVKASSANDLHITYNKINTFVTFFNDTVKRELISRIKKTLAKKGNKISTELGDISLVERANFQYDSELLLKFLKKKKLKEIDLFNANYEVVTKNQKDLVELEDKGLIKKTLKLDSVKAENLIVRYPELQNLITNEPTLYLKNL
jgi:hypothetical protein